MNYILLILLTMLTSTQLSAQTDQAAKMEHTGKTGHENPFAQCLTPGVDSLYSGMISLLDFTKILSYYDSVSTFNLHLEVKPDGKALITTKDNRFGTHAILSFSQKRKTQLTNSFTRKTGDYTAKNRDEFTFFSVSSKRYNQCLVYVKLKSIGYVKASVDFNYEAFFLPTFYHFHHHGVQQNLWTKDKWRDIHSHE